MIERHFERTVRIGRFALCLENYSRVQVGRAVGAVSRTFVGKHHMRLAAAVEMLAKRIFHALANMVRESRSDLDLLARNPNLHESHVYGIFARFGSRACLLQGLPKKSGGP